MKERDGAPAPQLPETSRPKEIVRTIDGQIEIAYASLLHSLTEIGILRKFSKTHAAIEGQSYKVSEGAGGQEVCGSYSLWSDNTSKLDSSDLPFPLNSNSSIIVRSSSRKPQISLGWHDGGFAKRITINPDCQDTKLVVESIRSRDEKSKRVSYGRGEEIETRCHCRCFVKI